jgi:DNA-binding FrmR family transcriptional regulator
MKRKSHIKGFLEHTEKLNISGVSESKSKSYLDEVKKQNILDDLKRIEKYVSTLHNMIDKSQYLDDETKQNILELRETSHHIYNQEMDKELKRQKEDGKRFLSDSDVDDIVDRIKREEGF